MTSVQAACCVCLAALLSACAFDTSGVDFADEGGRGPTLSPPNADDRAPLGPFPDGGVVASSCLIISEYIEGQGNNNKAIELYNCGTTTLTLDEFAVCLVRNEDSSCSMSHSFAAVDLVPGAVHTACRTKDGTFEDPIDTIRDNCDEEAGSAVTFNGDDRLVVFRDTDGDGVLGSDEQIMDALGNIATPPDDMVWSDVDLRRCNFTPADGFSEFVYTDYYTVHDRHDATNFGVAPVEGC